MITIGFKGPSGGNRAAGPTYSLIIAGAVQGSRDGPLVIGLNAVCVMMSAAA